MSPRTPEQNKQIRIESMHKIMEAAFKLIAKNGYESTSISGIAKEAGVSKGLLYNYFESKEDLVKALVMDLMEEGDRLIDEVNNDNPRETLRALIQWFFEEMRERPEHWKLLTELTFQMEKFEFVREIVTAKMNEYIAVLEFLLAKMGYQNALNEARIIAALFDGIGIEILIAGKNYPMKEMEEYLIKKYCDEA